MVRTRSPVRARVWAPTHRLGFARRGTLGLAAPVRADPEFLVLGGIAAFVADGLERYYVVIRILDGLHVMAAA